ncbi:hypothetical protein BABINDRAFT_9075 [Babjeviella inositovora NRRL Y-12698]|uniref:GTP:AMP phosphotransferase, mitochondrial n=1 Tax=Babjeviella inositovora NRRL Y-12698 TaxID=984486 RepID=A0A1E3QMI7_9ASCO|nr:uncharacterized protein BABINDRAFT_9075 [Babjeviella inositovora NRRL Y-12698]ODQ78840.1 hypothetical protein BABINDRAFT_9075 [Babjeviella inositovora NRRL Y-12698]
MTTLSRPLRLLLLGAPGSGKGTQTSKLLDKFSHINPLSSGDLLRTQIAAQTPIGREASSYITNGTLVPDMTMINLLAGELDSRGWLSPNASWLLDGFPRTAAQAHGLDTQLAANACALNLVVELDVNEDVILERIENRWIHLPSGRIYNLQYNPPRQPFTDDLTGEPLSKRDDDNAEVFKKRLVAYNEQLLPLKEFYDKQGVLTKVSGDTSDIIFPKLAKLISSQYA